MHMTDIVLLKMSPVLLFISHAGVKRKKQLIDVVSLQPV